MLEKQKKRYRRHKKIRAKVFGTADKPRLCIFRSAKHIYAQLLIDGEKAKTIATSSDLKLRGNKSSSSPTELTKQAKGKKKRESSSPVAKAREVGKLIAKRAQDLKIKRVVFDRGGYKYHGRIRALAEGAREGGLIF